MLRFLLFPESLLHAIPISMLCRSAPRARCSLCLRLSVAAGSSLTLNSPPVFGAPLGRGVVPVTAPGAGVAPLVIPSAGRTEEDVCDEEVPFAAAWAARSLTTMEV